MAWSRQGAIFAPSGEGGWMKSHAQVPTVLVMDDTLRIFFSSRNEAGKSLTTFVDVDAEEPRRIRRLNENPLLDLGSPGAFDESGVMPCSIVRTEAGVNLYYIGWSKGEGTPYRLATGLAVSNDNGESFRRASDRPVLGRTADEPTIATSPFAMRDDGSWRMWYASETRWVDVNGRLEPLYRIRHATSADGIAWDHDSCPPFPARHELESTSRPAVMRDASGYRMWYSYRGSVDYRGNGDTYRIGYAESRDGRHWTRDDARSGIEPPASGWDHQMQEYPCVVDVHGSRLMFYNGNGFGLTGFGYAVWRD